jgi:hypothetical protein
VKTVWLCKYISGIVKEKNSRISNGVVWLKKKK